MASFSFDAGNAGKLLRIPLYAVGRAATLVIPRTTGRARPLWVFGSAVGVADGAEALLRVALAHGESAVWLTGTARDAAEAERRGIRSAPKGSLRGFWWTARAAVLVVTHGFGDVNRYAATGGVIVQLWHGIPLKRIGLDADVTSASPFRIAPRLTSRVLRALYRRTQRRIALVPAASEIVRGRLESAFGLPTARVPVTGEPRADVLSRGSAPERRARARAALDGLVGGLDPETSLVLYAPTWRDGAPDPAAPSGADLGALRELLEEADAVLLLRSHHLGRGASAPAGARIRTLGSDVVADVTPLLPGIDVLVTDYSSLAFDAALVPLPTLFLAPDLDEYARTRGFYGTYADVAGADPAADWAALVERLRAVLTDPRARGERVERCRELDRRVHAHRDGRNTERVYGAIRRLLPRGGPGSHGSPATTRQEDA